MSSEEVPEEVTFSLVKPIVVKYKGKTNQDCYIVTIYFRNSVVSMVDYLNRYLYGMNNVVNNWYRTGECSIDVVLNPTIITTDESVKKIINLLYSRYINEYKERRSWANVLEQELNQILNISESDFTRK